MARRKVAQGQKRSKSVEKAGDYLLSKGEFDSICGQLKGLTHEVIEAWATRGEMADSLEQILVKLHAARRNLETAVEVQS